MAQAVNRWLFTAEARVRAQVTQCGICGGQSGTGKVFSQSFGPSAFLLLVIIPPSLHTQLSPPHEVCDIPDQAARCHTLGPKLAASFLTRLLVGLVVKKYYCYFYLCNYVNTQLKLHLAFYSSRISPPPPPLHQTP
jgi:hypothetical protein